MPPRLNVAQMTKGRHIEKTSFGGVTRPPLSSDLCCWSHRESAGSNRLPIVDGKGANNAGDELG
jgi:hypothetical protein